jgi:hypothetical protein
VPLISKKLSAVKKLTAFFQINHLNFSARTPPLSTRGEESAAAICMRLAVRQTLDYYTSSIGYPMNQIFSGLSQPIPYPVSIFKFGASKIV